MELPRLNCATRFMQPMPAGFGLQPTCCHSRLMSLVRSVTRRGRNSYRACRSTLRLTRGIGASASITEQHWRELPYFRYRPGADLRSCARKRTFACWNCLIFWRARAAANSCSPASFIGIGNVRQLPPVRPTHSIVNQACRCASLTLRSSFALSLEGSRWISILRIVPA